MEGFQGAVHYFGQTIHFIDMTGFSAEANARYLVFDPARPWPVASISIWAGDVIKTIKITGRQVETEDSTI